MSGGAEIQELYSLVQEINTLLNTTVERVNMVEREGDTLASEMITLQQFTRMMYRLVAIMKQAGLGTEVATALARLSRLVMVARMASMSLRYLQSSIPIYGWFMAITGTVTASLSMAELTHEYMGEVQGH